METEYKYTSHNEQETMELAQNIESEKFPNMVICLKGELGSGKTVFVNGFAQSLGIDENITSPTFNLVKEYLTGELPLYHMDVYRLEDGDDGSVGLTDYFTKGGVTIIEWSERLEIKFKVIDEETRVITFIPYGTEYEDLLNAVL